MKEKKIALMKGTDVKAAYHVYFLVHERVFHALIVRLFLLVICQAVLIINVPHFLRKDQCYKYSYI